MDFNSYSSFERSTLISELTQGMEVAKILRDQMGPEYPVEIKEMLMQQIVSSYGKALFILGLVRATEQPHQVFPVPMPAIPSTPLSVLESPKSEDLHAEFSCPRDGKDASKKRKAASKWTRQVKVNCGSIHEGPPADGHSWRKYGQKDILNAKHSRSYYRCTYRSLQDCWATKQVQRSDDDPTVLHITYKGKHTCTVARRSKSAPTSPGTQQNKPHNVTALECQQDCTVEFGFHDAIGADTQSLDSFPFSSTSFGYLDAENQSILSSTVNHTNDFYGSFSSSLISPTTSGSNYFSTATSATDSPTIELDFSLDQWSFDPSFCFNNL